MTTKFLKTYLWAFVALTFIFAVGTMVIVDSYTSSSGSSETPFARNASILMAFSLPALICLVSFVLAKIVDFKAAKFFRFKISAIAIDFAIVLAMMIMAIMFVKISENASLSSVISFGNPNFQLILLFAFLAAFPVILLKASLTNFKERIAELNWDKLGGKFFLIFYLATLLLSTISIIFAFITYERTYPYFADFNLAVCSTIFCFTITVLLSAFLSAAADFLGKHTKSISILLLIVFLGVLSFGSFLYFILGLHCSSSQAFTVSNYYNDYYGDYYEGEEYDEGYYEDNGGYYYDEDDNFNYDGLDENNKLSFLWNNPEDDADNFKAAIKFGLRELDLNFENMPFYEVSLLTGRYIRDHYEDKRGGLVYRRLVKFIDQYRKQLPLLTLANAYWEQITQNIPEKIYKKKKLDEFVSLLRWTYIKLYNETESDPYTSFHSIYQIMSNVGLPNLYEYYPLIKHFIAEDELPYQVRDSEGVINKDLAVWLYSFWGRRYNDGTAADVYQILNMLHENYPGD